MKRNILTIATGKKLYIDLAVNLARSFFLWNTDPEISFYLVTDQPQLITDDLKGRIYLININPGELGEGFSPKLFLDKVSPEGQTLFIDSDCLIFGNLSVVFDKFRGHNVSVIGSLISSGDWFGNISRICADHQIPGIPKFNGGVYYLEKGPIASDVYATARELEKLYDELGFTRLRNRPNDEVIMALAMQLHHQSPIPEDGSIMAEFVNFQTGFKADILNGEAILHNNPVHKLYQPNWPLKVARPLIVHFVAERTAIYPYTMFAKQLYYKSRNMPQQFIRLITFFIIMLPWYLKYYSKTWMRPLYHFLFGYRKIKKSTRI